MYFNEELGSVPSIAFELFELLPHLSDGVAFPPFDAACLSLHDHEPGPPRAAFFVLLELECTSQLLIVRRSHRSVCLL